MGSGDCGEVFFLDKETIYQLSQCAPAPEAFTLTPYRRLNQEWVNELPTDGLPKHVQSTESVNPAP